MNEKSYRVWLLAPIGRRPGLLTIRESNGRVEGFLNLLNRKNELLGSLSPAGRLTLSGAIQTSVSTQPFTAAGTVRGRRLRLNLKTARGETYCVCGEECDPDGKIL